MPCALVDLDEVDADGFDVDQQLVRARDGIGDVLDSQHLRPARSRELESLASPTSVLRPVSSTYRYFSIPLAIVCSCMLLVPS